MLKIVLDTNVILAAYLTKGAASRVIEQWAQGGLELLVSREIIEEYLRVLLYKKIDPFLVSEFNNQLEKYAKLVSPRINLKVIKDDPDDNKFVECAVAGSASYIVSNDKHLLKVKCYEGIKIVSVQAFLEFINEDV